MKYGLQDIKTSVLLWDLKWIDIKTIYRMELDNDSQLRWSMIYIIWLEYTIYSDCDINWWKINKSNY